MVKINSINVIKNQVSSDIADAISSFIESTDEEAIKKSAFAIAKAFGVTGDYSVEATSDKQLKLATRFCKNLALLIQKTWVEKFDISLKSHVLEQLEIFLSDYKAGKWHEAFILFLSIMQDAVNLMFGSLTGTDDFCEYTVRIDPEFGVFWCYIDCLINATSWQTQKEQYALNLGMYFISNY